MKFRHETHHGEWPSSSQRTIRPTEARPRTTGRARLLRVRVAQLFGVVLLLTGALTILPATVDSAVAAPTPFSISTNPTMVPTFSSNVTDYAIHCTSSKMTHLVTTGAGKVTVAGKTYSNAVNLELPLVADQSVQVTRAGKSFYIRCLPSDFPAYTSTVTGHPQANGYLVTLFDYIIAFDNHGVPVWWYKDTTNPAPRTRSTQSSSTLPPSPGLTGPTINYAG